MGVTCKNILNYPYAGQLRLIAGEAGVNHVVEWVHYMEEPEYVEWLRGGELVMTTGITLSKSLDSFHRFVRGLSEKNAAGLVVNVGFHLMAVPPSVIRLANELELPLYEMPRELRMVDISQSICSRIVQKNHRVSDLNKILIDLIYGKRITQKQLLNLENYNYRPGGQYCSAVVQCEELDIQEEATEEFQLYEEENQEEFLNKVANCLNLFLEARGKKPLFVVDNDMVVLVVPTEKGENMKPLFREMLSWVRDRVDIRSAQIGIGYRWSSLEDFKSSVESAQHAIIFGERIHPEECIFDYANLAAVRIFDGIGDRRILRSVERQVLGRFFTKEENLELFRTLEMYFQQECNVRATADALFIHENTMRYRLRKIERLLGRSLKDHNDVFEIELALRIREYLDGIEKVVDGEKPYPL